MLQSLNPGHLVSGQLFLLAEFRFVFVSSQEKYKIVCFFSNGEKSPLDKDHETVGPAIV